MLPARLGQELNRLSARGIAVFLVGLRYFSFSPSIAVFGTEHIFPH